MADVPAPRGCKLSQCRINHKHKGEKEDREVGGDGDRPVLLGEKVEPNGGEDGGGEQRPAEVEEEEGEGEEVEDEAVNCTTGGRCRAVLGHS